VLATALACFLAVLVMLSARVYTGTGQGLPSAAVVSAGGRTILRTTASGRVISETQAPGGAGASSAPGVASATPPATRSSGAAPGGLGDE